MSTEIKITAGVIVYLIIGFYVARAIFLEEQDEIVVKGGEILFFGFMATCWPMFALLWCLIVGFERMPEPQFTIRRKSSLHQIQAQTKRTKE
jgi:hypothetical protein